jgi:hypothetical protein
MGKRIDVFCTLEIKDIFLSALRNYTEVAFPDGSADCVLVAREALFDALTEFESEYAKNQDHRASYNKRLRAMIKEGIRLHYQLASADRGHECPRECALMLEVADGIAHTDEELATARMADQAS